MTRETDMKELSNQLAERIQEIKELKAQLEDKEAENQSLNHKYSITIRVCNLLNIILNLKTVLHIGFNIDFKICYDESFLYEYIYCLLLFLCSSFLVSIHMQK